MRANYFNTCIYDFSRKASDAMMCVVSYLDFRSEVEVLLSKIQEAGKIGFLGCGKLAQWLLSDFVDRYPNFKEKLMISYKSSASTRKALEDLSLDQFIAENQRLCKESDVLFVGLRPQDSIILKEMSYKPNATLVSLMAGVSVSSLSQYTGLANILRVMFGAPTFNRAKKGVCALYGKEASSSLEFFKGFSSLTYCFMDEKSIDFFSVVVNLPNLMSVYSDPSNRELLHQKIRALFSEEKIDIDQLFKWSEEVLALPDLENVLEDCRSCGATRGGVLEAINFTLKQTGSVIDALNAGVYRAFEFREMA